MAIDSVINSVILMKDWAKGLHPAFGVAVGPLSRQVYHLADLLAEAVQHGEERGGTRPQSARLGGCGVHHSGAVNRGRIAIAEEGDACHLECTVRLMECAARG